MADALGTPGPPGGPGVVSALDHRLDQAALIAAQGSGMAVRTGVLLGPGTTTLVTGTSATGTMTYALAAHHWVTTRGTADGVYLGATEAVQTVPTAAAPGSNSRIDVIWERQQDQYSTVLPDATSAPEYGVTSGTAAASPTKPNIPAGALELATAVVAAGATSTNGAGVTITNSASQTVARGAPIPVRSKAERDGLTKFVGLAVARLDQGGRVERYTGTGDIWADSSDVPVLADIAARNAYFTGNLRAGASALVAGNLHVYDGAAWRFTLTGVATGNTDASGFFSVAHGAGQSPTAWGPSVRQQSSDALSLITGLLAWASDGTNLTARAVNQNTNNYFASVNPITFSWWAKF